ncbi:MAG: Asp-tRNA(Asn)/Glu-tRNA(Gln) amidotransferase GatCAB subunit A, partial [Calditrichaeota bacterium]
MISRPLTIGAVQEQVADRKLDLIALTQEYLQRIEQNPSLNAFLEVYAPEAQARAAEVQEKIQSGKAGLLAGAVIALKDNIAVR